jgi:hypothetical protein
MADKHPYVSANGTLVQVLDHLKKSFPTTLDADVLRKLGYAPHNESYIINTLRFVKLIDEKGGRTHEAQKTFTLHDATSFSGAFSALVKTAYADLFKLHGDAAWGLNSAQLITYFRQTDQSTELVGTRQANTFRTLATYAGQTVAAPASGIPNKPKLTPSPKPKAKASQKKPAGSDGGEPKVQFDPGSSAKGEGGKNFGLTVRVEINLPATGDQATYDKIFKSIRENLLNG